MLNHGIIDTAMTLAGKEIEEEDILIGKNCNALLQAVDHNNRGTVQQIQEKKYEKENTRFFTYTRNDGGHTYYTVSPQCIC